MRLAQRAHGQSLAHRGFDLAARDADVPQGSIVEPMELANGTAQAPTRGQVVQHPGAAHRNNAEPLGERMQGAAQAGLDDEGALDAGPPLAFDEGRQRKGIDSLRHGRLRRGPSAPTGRARPQTGSKLLSTRAVQAAARQRMAGYVAATGKNGLKQTRSFLGDFLEISNADAVREVSWGRFGPRPAIRPRNAIAFGNRLLRAQGSRLSSNRCAGPCGVEGRAADQFRGGGSSIGTLFISLVSGISSQTSANPRAPMQASPRKALPLPSRSLIHPAKVVLTEAPIPIPVPTIPCARLKWPVPRVMSAIVSGTSTPNTAAQIPSSTCTATSR